MKTLLEPRSFGVSGSVAGIVNRTVENSSVNSDCDIIAIQRLVNSEIITVNVFVSRNAEFRHILVQGNYVDVTVDENIAGVTGYMDGSVEHAHMTTLLSASSAVEVSQDILDELGKSDRVIERILAVRAGIKAVVTSATSDDHIERLISKYQAQIGATESKLLKDQLANKVIALQARLTNVATPSATTPTAPETARQKADRLKAEKALQNA